MTVQGDDLASMQRALASLFRGATLLDGEAGAIAVGSERLTPSMQLAIYREQYVLRHVGALRDDFRSLANLLGEEAFAGLATAYFQALPPSSFTLRDLGQGLARFVAETRPWSDDRFLTDLARVEWAFVEAYDAPDAPPLDLAHVASLPEEAWPSLRLVLQPAVQRLALAYPAHEHRLAVLAASAPCASLPRPEARASYVVVFRGTERLQCLAIEAEAYALLAELASGTPLGQACERVAVSCALDASAAFEEKVGAWFQRWTALGWISRVERG